MSAHGEPVEPLRMGAHGEPVEPCRLGALGGCFRVFTVIMSFVTTTATMCAPTLKDVYEARERVYRVVKPTPLRTIAGAEV